MVLTWSISPWEDGLSREELLEVGIQELEQRLEILKFLVGGWRKQERRTRIGLIIYIHCDLNLFKMVAGCWFRIVAWTTNITPHESLLSDGLGHVLGGKIMTMLPTCCKNWNGTELKIPTIGKKSNYFKG